MFVFAVLRFLVGLDVGFPLSPLNGWTFSRGSEDIRSVSLVEVEGSTDLLRLLLRASVC